MLTDSGIPIDRRLTDSAISGLNRRKQGDPTSELSPTRRQQYFQKLLKIDLKPLARDPEKLYKVCTDLQILALEIDRKSKSESMQEEADTHLAPDLSNNRRRSYSSELSQKGPFEDGEGFAIVFSPSDNRLTIRQLRSMRTADYIKADLPSFHWWSDTLYIYFEKRLNDPSATDQAQVTVSKSYLSHSREHAHLNFFRTIKLGQLGFGIKVRRILGQVKVLYVMSPQSRSSRSSEMSVVDGANG